MEGLTETKGRGARFWLWMVVALIGLVLCAANFQKVTIDFIVGETNAPLVIALLIAGAIGFVLGLLLTRFRRKD
jgi:uncharacterized integral membrane protein